MSTYHRWPVVSMSILCFLSVSQCMNVLAQTADTLDRVVVTAGHLETKRSEAPIAITQLDSGQLADTRAATLDQLRTEEHTSELQSIMSISYAVFCLQKQKHIQ